MSLTTLPRRRPGLTALGLATGLALSSLVSAGPATAVKPAGSRAEVILEAGSATGVKTNALTAGWWGHEGGVGPAGTQATFLSMDLSQDVLTQMGTDDIGKIYFAIVPYSADGHNERPDVAVGESAADAFQYVFDKNLGSGLNGTTNANDSVLTVSTKAQFAAYVAAGRPVQAFDDNLVLHDATSPGSPVSAAPQGTSLLKTWAAGTKLSLVAFVSAGPDPAYDNQIQLVDRGSDGKAKTAWLSFTTVASPTSGLRTSAGYEVAGPAKPTVTVTHALTGTSGTVTATLKKADSSTATDATGAVEFAEVVNNVPGTPTSVTASNGVATLPITVPLGASKTYEVRYLPDVAGQASYLTSDPVRHTVNNPAAPTPTATATSLTVTGTDTYVLTAGVSPGAAGTVAFSDDGMPLGQAAVSAGSAKLTAPLAPGQHALKAVFAPTNATAYAGSTGTVNIWVPKVTTTVSPKKVAVGKKPKLTVALDTPGTTATGAVTVTITSPKGKATTLTATLAGGKATAKLPKAVKGKYTIAITYAGGGTVLGVTTSASFKAKPAKK